jgi:hypothetical protein
MADVSPALVDELLASQLDLLRLEAGVRARVVTLLDRLQRELVARLAAEDLTDFNKARINSLIAQISEVIDSYYLRVSGESQAGMDAAAQAHVNQVIESLSNHFVANLDASLPTATFMERLSTNSLIFGAPSSDWWERQAQDTAFRFANVVRQGIVEGATNEEIVARVAGRRGFPGIMDISRTHARGLVHTSIQEVASEARMETYRKNADVIEGIRQVSTLDSHTTEICIAYDGAEFDLEGEPLEGTDLPYNGGTPRHWACRSIEVPITKTFRELGIDIPEPGGGTRASADGQVPANTTFADFLDRMGTAFQDETLGPGRAQLWRDDKITLTQLLDLSGNPLSLEELQAKYG